MKSVRIFSNTYRQSVKVVSGSPATRARHPILNAKLSFLSFKIKFEPTFFQVLWRFAFPLPLLGEAGPAQIPSGLCGVNSRGLGGIFTSHFERSEIVAGPPAEPVNEIGSDIFKYTPPICTRRVFLPAAAGGGHWFLSGNSDKMSSSRVVNILQLRAPLNRSEGRKEIHLFKPG